MSQKLPQDLQKYIRSRILKRLSVLIILIAAIGTLLFFLGDRIFDFENTGLKILCYAVTLLIPFWISGVPAKLIDSTWSGKIVDINTELTTGSESSVKPSQETLYTQRNVYLTVVTPDGRTVRRRVYSGQRRHIVALAYRRHRVSSVRHGSDRCHSPRRCRIGKLPGVRKKL